MIGVSIKAIIISKINDLLCHKLFLTLVDTVRNLLYASLSHHSCASFLAHFFQHTNESYAILSGHLSDNLQIIDGAKMEVR